MLRAKVLCILIAGVLGEIVAAQGSACPDYTTYSASYHAPFSSGRYNLSSMRPSQSCRTFVSPEVESTISRLQKIIKDPDLFRLFQNSWPNTLDTTVKWRGYAAGTDEELSFVITGDIDAMWLRDSANQVQSYLPLLTASTSNNSLASLYRGVINLQARYILSNPFCQSFQPPAESGLPPSVNGAASDDTVFPPYSNLTVFECKYELDSLAAFLEVSTNYFTATQDVEFFGKYQWINTIKAILNETQALLIGTYSANGSVNIDPYTFTREATSSTETNDNSGKGNPIGPGTGLVRSWFRPSDDATIFQGFIPANMMFSRYLDSASVIADGLHETDLACEMTALASQIRAGISKWSIGPAAPTSKFSTVYGFEVDGYGSRTIMDDANVPNLLSAPVYGYLPLNDTVYQETRKLLLSPENPYYMQGPVLSGIGSPHTGLGRAWHMALISQILTTNDDGEIRTALKQILGSTDGLGLIHESINTYNQSDFSRPWFAWANGLFGEAILDLSNRKPYILQESFQ